MNEEMAMLIIFVPSFLFGIALLGFILSDSKKYKNNQSSEKKKKLIYTISFVGCSICSLLCFVF